MATIPSQHQVIKFGVFEVDLAVGEVRKAGMRQKLTGQPFQVLQALLERPQEIVTREELRERLWPDNTFVDYELALKKAVNRLREVLGDSADSPHYIETVPRRGYRFIAPLSGGHVSSVLASPVGDVEPATATAGTAPALRRPRALRLFMVVGGVCVLLAGAGLIVRNQMHSRMPAAPIRALAVLPLENLSRDPEQEYFADGMTDELITQLAQISAVRVISRTSVMRYKGAQRPLGEIARELNVDAVVEGTVARSPERVRVTAQVVRVNPEEHVWAERYDRPLGDVVTLQGTLAQEIAQAIRIQLTPQQKARFSKTEPANFEAYVAYLKGRYEWNKRTPESLKQGMRYFEDAIAKDPSYALAHEGLAETYTVLDTYGVLSAGEAYPKAKTEAVKALELDDTLGEAHAVLAGVRRLEWDWMGVEQEYRRAIELSPSSATAHQWYGDYLFRAGRLDQGLAEMQRARELDPASPLMNGLLGLALYWARQYDKSIQQLGKTIEMEPDFASAHAWLGLAYEQKIMRGQAIQEFQRAVDLSRGSPAFRGFLGYGYALSGDRRKARTIAEKLTSQSRSKGPYVSPVYIALVYMGLGDKGQAFYWFEKACAVHDNILTCLKVEPLLDSLRSDPRFVQLVARIGLPQ